VALDFTLAAFDQFCQQITHMPVFTLADFLARDVAPPTPYLILRVDVDYREHHAIQMARIAEHYHLNGSFYFRHRSEGFDLNAMRAVAALDHEVGYHFETLDTCGGNFEQAERLFLDHLGLLRDAGLKIRTVAAHGTVPTANTYQANFALFTRAPDLFQRARLIGETTLSLDFTKLVYISDANWRWRRYTSYSAGTKGKPTSLKQIMAELPRPNAALYITFHPQQWFPHPASTLYFRTRHRLGRVIIPLFRMTKRKIRLFGWFDRRGKSPFDESLM
jgi:hypothetical protein